MEKEIKNMSLINKDNINKNLQKDIFYPSDFLSQKGQKILAALYLVTGHISATDPLVQKIRQLAVTVASTASFSFRGTSSASEDRERFFSAIHELQSFLSAAFLSHVLSEKNYHILKAELAYFGKMAEEEIGAVQKDTELTTPFFDVPIQKDMFQSKRHIIQNNVLNKNIPIINKEEKNDRLEKITDFINSKRIVSIKDISSLFQNVSEKTIQRELNRLLADGKIRKRGNKRWSMYLSLDA